MSRLVFIPSYNDCKHAFKLFEQFASYPEVDKILIIDDSDTPECINYYKDKGNEKLEVMHGTRNGKWAAWAKALEIGKNYDSLIQIDSDIEIESLYPILSALESSDIVTAYVNYSDDECSWVAKRMIDVYRRSHRQAYRNGKLNMGGALIALNKITINSLIEHGIFNESVRADDHIVALAAKSLGFSFKTVEAGVTVKLPRNTWEWILFKSRHVGTVSWARQYVKAKLNNNEAVVENSKNDYRQTFELFVRNLLESSPLTIFVYLFISLVALLPLTNKTQWKRLESTKS